MVKVQIRNKNLPNCPRLFDVNVTKEGRIVNFVLKNIRGTHSIDANEVKKQIQQALSSDNTKSELPSNRIH